MSEQYMNLGSSTCTGTLDNSTNPITVVVASGAGANFPATTNGPYRIVVFDSAGTNAEVMLVTHRATDTMTATRGNWSSTVGASETPIPTLSTHSAGSTVVQAITAGAENQIRADQHRTGFSGALPTDGYQGDVLYPTDDCVASISNSGTFYPAHVVMPLRGNPNAQTWSWLNQGGASVTTRSQSILLKGTATTGANIQARVMTAPSTPYAVVATIIPYVPNGTFAHAGILFTDGTKISEIDVINDALVAAKVFHFSSAHYNSATSFNAANTLTWDAYLANGQPISLLLQDDGTNKKFGVSFDCGLYIQQVFSESHTSFLTPTEVGFFYDSNGSNQPGAIEVVNWYVSTSTLF